MSGDDKVTGPVTSKQEGSSVVLRGEHVPLTSGIGLDFMRDCARNTEGVLDDAYVKEKWGLTNTQWAGLARNVPLLIAIRKECARRVLDGDAVRERAAHELAQAPVVLGRILRDELAAPRARIESSRELRQMAGHDEHDSKLKQPFIISINIGDGKPIYQEVAVLPPQSPPEDDVS